MKRRTKAQIQKAAAKASRARNPGGNSKYARKVQWCRRNGVWGWEVPSPKPWRSA